MKLIYVIGLQFLSLGISQSIDGDEIIRYGYNYKGELLDGNRHGEGIYYYVNGDIYEGNWKNNKKDDNTLKNLRFICPNCYYQKSNKSIYEKKNDKMTNCVDCGKRMRKKVKKISLNPRCEIIDTQIKHKYTKTRCDFCMRKKIIEVEESINGDFVVKI